MKKLLLLIMMCSGIVAFSQKTSNVDFRQVDDKVIVTYDLSSQSDISLFIAVDGGKWNLLESVTGDVGKGIRPGKKRIEWDVFEDYPDGIHGNVELLVAPNVGSISSNQIPATLHAENPVISDYKAYWTKKGKLTSHYAGDVRKGTFASATDQWSFTLEVYCYDFLKQESSIIYSRTYSGRSMRKQPYGEYRSYFRDEPIPACKLSIDDNGRVCIDNTIVK